MAKNLPSDFTDKILAKDRISFGDVRRLKRDILPDGVASREEAEALLGLDRAVTKADAAWERWLVTTSSTSSSGPSARPASSTRIRRCGLRRRCEARPGPAPGSGDA